MNLGPNFNGSAPIIKYDQDLPYKIRKKVNLKICLAALDSNEKLRSVPSATKRCYHQVDGYHTQHTLLPNEFMDRATTTIVRVVTDVEFSGKTCQAKPSAFPIGIFCKNYIFDNSVAAACFCRPRKSLIYNSGA